MAKQIFAVTNIKTGSGFAAAGTVVDPTALSLTKADLLDLHANGAIEVRLVEDETSVVETDPTDLVSSDGDDKLKTESSE